MAARFEILIEKHHDEIFAYLWRLLGSQHGGGGIDVEDIVQDVFMRAYEAFSKLRPDSNHRAWLYKIATNRAFTKLRRAKLEREKLAALETTESTRVQPSTADQRGTELRAAIERLTPKQKACITLRYFNDLEYAEIAAIVNCSAVSARANVSQAVRKLEKILKESL